MTAAEAEQAFPWLQPHWDLSGPFFARPPGGDSLADVAMRVRLVLEDPKREFAGKRVLMVTHGGPPSVDTSKPTIDRRFKTDN